MKPTTVLIDRHPGRSTQSIGLARAIGTDPDLIHEPSVGVVGTKGDSQCYLGVMAKVEAIHAQLKGRIGAGQGQLKLRLVQPEYTIATSDGIRNGTREMRYSLIGREVTQRCAVRASQRHRPRRHDRGRRLRQAAGRHAGRPARAQPALDHHVGRLDPSRHRPQDRRGASTSSAPTRSPAIPTPSTATTSPAMPAPASAAAAACSPTTPCRPSSAWSACSRCTWWRRRPTIRAGSNEFAAELVDHLANLMAKDLKPRDIVVRDSLRNAVIVAMAIGGSTNVTLHAPEIARAAGFGDFWKDIITPEEFNYLSQHVVPVLTDARPYGKYSMVDIDTGRRRAGDRARAARRGPAERRRADLHRRDAGGPGRAPRRRSGPTARSSTPSTKPYKPTGGLRVLGGNLSPDFSAILKLAGVEGGLENNLFRGKARVFEGEQALLDALDQTPEQLPEPRHGDRALRGAERRAGHARDARSDVAHHDALPRARHRRRR